MELLTDMILPGLLNLCSGLLLTCGTWYWLRTLWRVRNKKSAAFYPVLFTWFLGALLYVLITNAKIITEEIKPKERPLVNLILLIGMCICVLGLPYFLHALEHWRIGDYIFGLFFWGPYVIGGFLLYNSTKRRYLVPTVILLCPASLPLLVLIASRAA